MCIHNENCSNEPNCDACPILESLPTSVECVKNTLEVLLTRQDACNELIFAVAKAIGDGVDNTEAVLCEVNTLLANLAGVDETVNELLVYIDEEENGVYLDDLCEGCPYADECGGDCYFEDEDFFRKEEESNIAEE